MSKPGLPDDAALPATDAADKPRAGDDGQPTGPLAERLRQHAGRIQSLRRKAPALVSVTGTNSDASSSASALLMRVLAALPDGERRQHPRLVINANVFHERHPHGPIGTTRNIGLGGMFLSFHVFGPDIIQFLALGGTLTVEGLGSVTARITRLEEDAAFLDFEWPLDAAFDAALKTLTAQMHQHHAPYLTLSGVLAEQIQDVLVGQIIRGEAMLEEIMAAPGDVESEPVFPRASAMALHAIMQSEVETLVNVRWMTALHCEGHPVCEAKRELVANCPDTRPNSAVVRANKPELPPKFGVDPPRVRAPEWTQADMASLAFAARISPVPSVQAMSSIQARSSIQTMSSQQTKSSPAAGGEPSLHHMASSPVYVLGRRWGAAAVIYHLPPAATGTPQA